MTLFALFAAASLAAAKPTCLASAGGDAGALLRRAAERTGLDAARGKILSIAAYDITDHTFESDRTYPPALQEVANVDEWFDPASGVDRIASRSTIGGYAFRATTVGSSRASYVVRDTGLVPSESTHGALYATRPLNVWAMLDDWLAAADVRLDGICDYRDYPRVVLRRQGLRGPERLFVDPKSGYPVKLDRIEPHYLWGQVHVEFVYSTWERVGDAHYPGGSARLEDGVTRVTRTYGVRRFVPPDSAPALRLPAIAQPMGMAPPPFLVTSEPDTIRVSPTTFLLHNPGYTEAVALVRDTVFVFDATEGEERVQRDSVWIGKLFPGHHPIVLVVTDLAWPHVAGVRAWVARGATIVAHRAARDFLAQLVARRWTLAPDLLERRRGQARFRFRPVDHSLSLANGEITLFAIDGAASEVALAGFLRTDQFLWASDYVQNLSGPSQYVDEMVAAVRRVGVAPSHVAAEHLRLTDWARVAALAADGDASRRAPFGAAPGSSWR